MKVSLGKKKPKLYAFFSHRWVGRVNVLQEHEPVVTGFSFIINAGLSYGTFGYVLSLQGANKLLDGKPLDSN